MSNYDQHNQTVSGDQINIGGIILYFNRRNWPTEVKEWEYKDFIHTFPVGQRPTRGAVSLVRTRRDIWNENQSVVLPELQRWLDDGWEPITEIGIGGLQWESYSKTEVQLVSLLFFFLVIPLLYDLTHPTIYEMATAFRVKMRRPKR